MGGTGRFENLIGVNVVDEAAYQAYRDGIAPVLARHAGAFGYDFRVAEVLRSRTDKPMNRVFTLQFPDEAAMDAFFADADYLAVRRQHLRTAVDAITTLAEYEPRPDAR